MILSPGERMFCHVAMQNDKPKTVNRRSFNYKKSFFLNLPQGSIYLYMNINRENYCGCSVKQDEGARMLASVYRKVLLQMQTCLLITLTVSSENHLGEKCMLNLHPSDLPWFD